VTNIDGIYEIRGLTPGDYDFKASIIGYTVQVVLASTLSWPRPLRSILAWMPQCWLWANQWRSWQKAAV